MATLTEPARVTTSRPVRTPPDRRPAAVVERVSGRFPPWVRPANLHPNALLPWLAERGEVLPYGVVRAVSAAWAAERG